MIRTALFIVLLFAGLSCKQDKNEPHSPETDITITDSIEVRQQEKDLLQTEGITIKHQELVTKADEKEALGPLIQDKNYFKESDFFVLDFNYPYLNEKYSLKHNTFNQYIEKNFLNIKEVEAQILEDKELLCDTLRYHQTREKRLVNYKVYEVNDKLLSVLFYKENHYSGAMHPSYTFDCLNYDLERGVFMGYDDFFIAGSEKELRDILNEVITSSIQRGDLYYDCWEITPEDFIRYKNNFVVDDASVAYYFEDCVVCPSYTGEYSVTITLDKLLPVLKRYNLNPLKF